MIIFFIFWSCFCCTIFKIIIPLIKNENINGVDIAATLLWGVPFVVCLFDNRTLFDSSTITTMGKQK